MRFLIFSLSLFIFLGLSCGGAVYTRTPRGSNRVILPQKGYQHYEEKGMPYSFDYPIYGEISKREQFFDGDEKNPFWLNVDFTEMGASIYLSYNKIAGKAGLVKLLDDAHFMSFYHSKRADFIEDRNFHTENDVHGILYKVGGDAASAYQFIATDSNAHFLRGALYFNVTPNADSLKPMNDFLQADIVHLIETLKWH